MAAVCSFRPDSTVSLLLSYWLIDFSKDPFLTCSDFPAIYLHTHPTEFLLCLQIYLFKRDVTCPVTPTIHCSVNKYR